MCIDIDSLHFQREKERKSSTRTTTTQRPQTTPASTSSTPQAAKGGGQSKKKGPLTQDEKDKRRKEGLCMYCGKKGHFAKECPEAPKKQAAELTTGENAKIEEDFADGS